MPRVASLSAVLLALLSILAACAPLGSPADPALARQVCALDPDQPLPAGRLGSGVLAQPLSQACVEQLGWDLGVDWDAYGQQPRAFDDADSAAEALVSGAFLVLAADHGSVGELAEDPLAPAWARQALLDEAARVGLWDDDLAGDLLYAWITSRVQRVAPGAVPQGSTAYYQPASATIRTEDDSPGQDIPPWLASVLVHETAHRAKPHHVRCADGQTDGCDEDLDGPYGMQAWIARRYADRLDLDSEAGLNACADATLVVDTACSMINDPGAAELCASLPAC